jgi:hypothetical protein
MIEWCEVCKTKEAWSRNLKHPICARCGVLAWQKLSEDAAADKQCVQRTVDQPREKHNMEFCSECFPVVVVDFNRQ